MNQLRLKKQNEYIIEINDKGDTIAFNIEDPTLPLRLEKAYEEINHLLEMCKVDILATKSKSDKPVKGKLLDERQRAILQIYNTTFTKMRKAMDSFLGAGACQKIFGDTNYLSMFEDLLGELTPHFEKMNLNGTAFMDSLIKKYGDDEDDSTIEVN